MKRIQIISLVLLTITGQYTRAVMNLQVPDWAKKPSQAVSVVGNAPRSYSVVFTKITKDPSDKKGKPVIVRNVKSVKNSGAGSAPINEELAIPQADIILSAGQLPDAAAAVAGAIDPRAGAAAKGVSALLDEGLNIAGQELTKKYGLNAFEIKLIELLPTEYYYIDNVTNAIKTKDAFLPALQNYTQLLSGYAEIAEKYNKAVLKYNPLRNQIPAQRPPNVPKFAKERADYDTKYNAAMAVWNNEVKPALAQKLDVEGKLTNYSLHRIALMASQDKPGNDCTGGWQGPWSLYLYYFIGSKQTNRIKIDFCAQRDVKQQFNIRINGNSQADGQFIPGGVNLEATDNKTIKFPVEIAAGKMNWDSYASALYNWFDEMIVNENGGDISTYMFPYDLFVLEQKRLKEQADKNDERSKENIEKFNAAIDELKEAIGNKGESGLLDLLGIGKGKTPAEEPEEEEPTPTSKPKPSTGGKTPASGGKGTTPSTQPSAPEEDAYSILGVGTDADDDEIKKAYDEKKATALYKNSKTQRELIDDAYNAIRTSALRKIYTVTSTVKSGAETGSKIVSSVSGIVGAITGGDKDKGTTKPSDKGKTPAAKVESIGDILKNDVDETPVMIDATGKTPSGNTYYEILGIQSDANTDQIDTAYRQKADLLVKAYNNSTGENKQKNLEKAKELQAAYDVLKDVKKRNEYSKKLEASAT